MLKIDDPHAIFNWLRGLSFMDAERRGLYPHDLAREAITADLHWRNPTRQAELHHRAREHYMKLFHEGGPREQRQVLSDFIFLHRENAAIRPYFEWQSTGTVFTDTFLPEDLPAILEMVRLHEGETAEAQARHWVERQPQGTYVFRQPDGALQGMMQFVSLDKVTDADKKLDPGTTAVWNYLNKHAPLRPGETATLFRFWMAEDTYQDVSPVQSRIFLNMVQHYLTAPRLAFTFIPCAQPEFWTAVFAFADLHRLEAADFEIDGQKFGIYGHDWRTRPPLAWLTLMAERELGSAPPMDDLPLPAARVLEEETFAEAVRDALRDFTNDLALQENPLLQARQVVESAGAGSGTAERIAATRKILQGAAEGLQAHPRQVKWYRALHHTYFQPAATQEQAAELLDVPFSTYRRHLREAIQYVQEKLWSQEINR